MNNLTKRRRLIVYRLTLISSCLVAGSLAIPIIMAINNLGIDSWAKGLILLAIGTISLVISKVMSKDVREAKRQVLKGGH